MNRPAELEKCLRTFIMQGKQYKMPIYISDNSTDESTAMLVSNLSKSYKWIYYQKRKPLGYADNVMRVLSMGDTEYAWLFGDDDIVKPGAIRTVIDKLRTGIDYLQVNSEVYSHDLKQRIKTRIIKKTGIEKYGPEDYEIALLNNDSSGYQGFMAHMIVRKSLLDKELRRIDVHGKNMDFIHTILFYRSIKGRAGMLLAEPIINNRGGNWSYSKRIMEIYFKSWYKTHHMLKGYYSDNTIDTVMRQTLMNVIIPVAINKITNKTRTLEDYGNYIKTNEDLPQIYKYVLFTVMLVPRFVIKKVFDTYKEIKGY